MIYYTGYLNRVISCRIFIYWLQKSYFANYSSSTQMVFFYNKYKVGNIIHVWSLVSKITNLAYQSVFLFRNWEESWGRQMQWLEITSLRWNARKNYSSPSNTRRGKGSNKETILCQLPPPLFPHINIPFAHSHFPFSTTHFPPPFPTSLHPASSYRLFCPIPLPRIQV